MKKFLVAILIGVSLLFGVEGVDDNKTAVDENQTVSPQPVIVKHTITYLNMDEQYKTFIKIFNKSECEIVPKVIVYGDNSEHNDKYSMFPISTSIKPMHSKIIFAKDIRSIAENIGIYLPDSFGMEVIYTCKGGKAFQREKAFPIVLQKSPEGQRVIPVDRNFDEVNPVGKGIIVIPHLFHEDEQSTIGGFTAFLKFLNTSDEDVIITIKAYPDSTGKEHVTHWLIDKKKATPIMSKDLYEALNIPFDTSIALVIEVPKHIEKIYPIAIQKTYDGPRVLTIYKAKE